MQKTFRYIILFFTCFTALYSSAQVAGIQTYSIDQNGRNTRLLTQIKSKEGFLYIGTSDGLYRFDGLVFTKIPFNEKPVNTAITAIAQEKSGRLWLGFSNGQIGYFDRDKVNMLNAEEGHPAVQINHIYVDTAETVYFSTAGEGIYYYKNKRFFNFATDNGLSDNYVYQLITSGNALLACTDKGINVFTPANGKTTFKTYTTASGLPDNIVKCLARDEQTGESPNWYAGFQDKGLRRFSQNNNSLEFDGSSIWPNGQINAIYLTPYELWAATEKQGILRFSKNGNKGTFQQTHSPALANINKASNIIHDEEGNIWLITPNQLVKTTGSQLILEFQFQPGMFEQIHTLLKDRRGRLWMNANNGLFICQPTESGQWKLQQLNVPGINPNTDITSLYEDKYGNIWAGTFGKGLLIFDPTTLNHRTVQEDRLLINGSIISISGKGDKIWISSLGGAALCSLTADNRSIYSTYHFQNFNKASGIGSNYVYSIFEDSKGRVWFATDGKGATVLANGKFTQYGKPQGLNADVVYNICEDKNGNIWLSTMNDGLYKFDGNRFYNIGIRNGLLSQSITSLATDAKGNIVALSQKGVNIINPENHAITYFDKNQGLEEINTDLNCIYASGNLLYFISNKGVIAYRPSYQAVQPKIALMGVKLFLDEIDFKTKTEFKNDENNLLFSFSGISFSHPEKLRYSYNLDGLSKEWVTTKDNQVNFPKLPPGKYTFRVRASLNDQFDGSNEASYSFAIDKPFWLKWWFLALAFSFITIIIAYIIRKREARMKRLERIQKEKIQSQFETLKSQVNPHFLFNSFNTLIYIIEENPDLAVEYVEHLSDLYRKIVAYRDKDLISLREELELLNDYFFIQKKRFGENIQLINHLKESEIEQIKIAPLTLQLLCENAVKHNVISEEHPLIIHIDIKGYYLVIKNIINAKLTTEKSSGMGLQNIQNRYKLLINKDIKVEKSDNEFRVYIPLIVPEP